MTPSEEQLKQKIKHAIKESIGFNENILELLSSKILSNLQSKWAGQNIYIPEKDTNDKQPKKQD